MAGWRAAAARGLERVREVGGGDEGMTGGAHLTDEKLEAQFTQPAGVEAHIWVSKI